jgi:2-oxoglutarate ferredoxin oxidoreductase subunit gamma
MAGKLGNPRVQNIVMMGSFIKKTGLITPEAFLKGLKQILGEKKKSAMEINRKAFAAGYELQI